MMKDLSEILMKTDNWEAPWGETERKRENERERERARERERERELELELEKCPCYDIITVHYNEAVRGQ